jgi:hypothetical protein
MSSVFRKHVRILLHNTVLKWVDNFSVCGIVMNKFVGLANSVRTPENIEQVRVVMHQSSTCWARQQVVIVQMLSMTLQRILQWDMRFHPYKFHIIHEPKEQDKASHVNFWGQFLDLVGKGFLNVLLMSHEAHFHLPGYVNKQFQALEW